MKSQVGRSRRGLIFNEVQCEDLDFCVTIFSVEINKLCVFASSLQVPLYIMHRESNFCVLKLFAKFVSFVRSHFDLTSVTWHAAAAVRV